MRTVTVLGFTIVLFILAITFATTLIGKHAVDLLAEQSNQPSSATDVIMRSRSTVASNPQSSGTNNVLGAGLLATFLLLSGISFLLIRGGTDFLRQLRLLKKKTTRRSRQQVPYIAEWSEQPIRFLQEVNDENSFNTSD